MRILEGLAVAHASLLVFFLIGAAVYPWPDDSDAGGATAAAPRSMMRVVCTTALGMSVLGFTLLAFGFLGFFSASSVVIAIVGCVAAASFAHRATATSPLRWEYWRARLTVLRRCWNGPLVALYLLMLVISCRAMVPNVGVSDPVFYHLAYAQDWVLAGRITVDPYLQFPFYANNFLLLFAALILLGAAASVNFLVWATATFIAFGVYAAIADDGAARGAPPATPWWRHAIALCASLAVMATTTFLDHSVQSYIDVPIGAAALAAVLAMMLALRERRTGWLYAAATIAAFLAGMKGSFILLVPIYLVALGWACVVLRVALKPALALLGLLCVLAAPWYVRNLIVAGDPIPPVINLAVYHQDGLITQSEWDSMNADLSTSHSPKAIVELPARAYWHPTSRDFREYGVTAMIVLLYVPTLVWLAGLVLRRRGIGEVLRPDIAIPIFVLTGFIGYYIVTSTLLRYTHLLYGLLAACVGLLLVELAIRRPRLLPLALAIALLAVLPSPGDDWALKSFYHDDLMHDVHAIANWRGEDAFLRENEDGYAEEEQISAWMREHGYGGNAYVIGPQLNYYFRRNGITSIGDFTGPSSYFRLLKAIDAGRAAEFLNDLDTRAVLLGPNNLMDANVERLLEAQLNRAGYSQLSGSTIRASRMLVHRSG